ncbi:PHD finger protein 20 isoform X4 [Oryzias melastigma]|uniref:PHD finger protein 20 isoform X4 n=1 Tax=Oryzias melastigma TaxID=30732 RepID=UPI000CF7F17E|nr:PHD finger protein 20 isoform X4 [Oryzias melastigma]
MSKTPPNRRGITFEVGAQLEARDSLKNWYAANIEKIDYEDEKVLIHYRQWSHRYDEWFDWTSPYLRPVERVKLRKQGLRDGSSSHGFQVNDKVLASWSDCRFYPAKVISVNKDGGYPQLKEVHKSTTYTVKFYDGVVQTVKEMHVKPFVKERGGVGSKSRSSDRSSVRRAPSRRDRRPQENGGPKNKRVRRSTSDQEEEDSNSEDEGRDQEVENDKSRKTDDELQATHVIKQEEESSEEEGHSRPGNEEKLTGLTNGVKVEKGEELNKGTGQLNGDLKREDGEKEKTGIKPYTQCTKPYTETPGQNLAKAEQASVTMTSTECNGSVEQKPNVQLENTQTLANVPPPQPVKPVRKQGFHNPNRFSREPLYRVIKNQPPLVLSVNLDHNPFKCTAPGCTKSFRKAKLLHYHMKYYHGEEQPMEGKHSPTRSVQTRASEKHTAAAGLDASKRRRTISASMHSTVAAAASRGDVKAAGRRTSAPPAVSTHGQQQRALLREKSKENQLDRISCQLQDSDKSGFDFDDDSISDWSTDSCGWSDDDFDMDLDVTTPPLSTDSGAVDTNDQEIVRCICEVEEENDFMIQCEDCLCWQHGTCMGLLEDNVPDRYTCYICRDPPGQRQSLRYWYDREWLTNGHMYGFSFLEENYSHQNAMKITTTHQLLGDVHHVVEVLNGLQLKMSILQNNPDPDLHLWRQPWKHLERSRINADCCKDSSIVPSPVTPSEDMSRGEILMSNALEKLSRAATAATSSSSSSCSPFPSFQDSYINSDHCYQKPRAYYPAVEQRLVVETRQASELEDSMRSTEELLEREQCYGSLLEMEKPKKTGISNKASMGVGLWSQAEKEDGRGTAETGDIKQLQQWQMNLLDHIDAVQEEVSHRMDFIERELDVLESWLDYTGELEPPDPLARLPQLKQRIKRLLSQLGKVQQIALYSST